MKYIQDDGLVIKSWCENPEEGAIIQAKNLAQLPFAFKQICLMPDVHQGYGMPVGGVMATKNYVVPNAVGVDVGCGIIAVKTSLISIEIESLKTILGEIRKIIPTGFNKHNQAQNDNLMPYKTAIGFVINKEYSNACKSIGTLGGGNHFLEIQKDEKGFIWIMIHSGSRNLGKKVADYYNKIAIEINEKYFSKVPKEWELAFLPIDSEEGQSYLIEMNYCIDFAFANRKLMMDRILDIFIDVLHLEGITLWHDPMINAVHNYVRMENHFDQNVMVHRKGAISAKEDEIGIIPGSQGTSSYIVKGLGDLESFKSCSHGAGRTMGRKQAIKCLNLTEEIKKLNDKGIIHSVRNEQDLDEAPGSYKNIETVMAEQNDLVEIIHKLEPLAVVKG